MTPKRINQFLFLLSLGFFVSCSTFSKETERDLIKSPCANNEAEEEIYQRVSLNGNENVFLDCASSAAPAELTQVTFAFGR